MRYNCNFFSWFWPHPEDSVASQLLSKISRLARTRSYYQIHKNRQSSIQYVTSRRILASCKERFSTLDIPYYLFSISHLPLYRQSLSSAKPYACVTRDPYNVQITICMRQKLYLDFSASRKIIPPTFFYNLKVNSVFLCCCPKPNYQSKTSYFFELHFNIIFRPSKGFPSSLSFSFAHQNCISLLTRAFYMSHLFQLCYSKLQFCYILFIMLF